MSLRAPSTLCPPPRLISLEEWDGHYAQLKAQGLEEPDYGGPLRRHVGDGDLRLLHLKFDNSPAALNLWNFLLTEEVRLNQARQRGAMIVGTMKDLGTVPVMVYALENAVAFYPDGAWWVPCVMQGTTCDLEVASAAGFDESFCPVRAMVGAMLTGKHFPRPDLLICSVGATCDDFSAIAGRLQTMGWPITWWEIPARRRPEAGEEAVALPGDWTAPASQVKFVAGELERLAAAIGELTGQKLDNRRLSKSIVVANEIRWMLREICRRAFMAPVCPMPAMELLIAQMLAIHYCSDRSGCYAVLQELFLEIERRVEAGIGVLPADAARIYWVNPVADLRAMNLLEECGGRLCGNDLMFCHAMDEIPGQDVPPLEGLARSALADPMVGSTRQRAARICREVRELGAEAVILSRIPGASHCSLEGVVFREIITRELGLPVIELEVPPISDAVGQAIRTRMEALVETVRARRRMKEKAKDEG